MASSAVCHDIEGKWKATISIVMFTIKLSLYPPNMQFLNEINVPNKNPNIFAFHTYIWSKCLFSSLDLFSR